VTSVDIEFGLTALAAMLSPTTLTFCVLALVLSERPARTGVWFFVGAFGVTLIIGIVAAFVLGDAAAESNHSNEPSTWVAIFDVVAALLLAFYVARSLRRPRNPRRTADAIEKMSKISSSPAIAIVAAGATLANPGGFIPIALKDISQLKPSAAGHSQTGRGSQLGEGPGLGPVDRLGFGSRPVVARDVANRLRRT
jgi:Sap, sulfolipid-1-addressing protein